LNLLLPTPQTQTSILIVSEKTRRQATGRRIAAGFEIKVPARWPNVIREQAAAKLAKRLVNQERKRLALLAWSQANQPMIAITGEEALKAFVEPLNQETFQQQLNKIRIGPAKHTRLAQINIRTLSLTVSRYCLGTPPEAALRYLILHELAHGLEANHSPKFWAHVARFCPDYQHQHRVMVAYHQEQVLRSDPAYVDVV
jgi:predicted metal-dependent hydrolase